MLSFEALKALVDDMTRDPLADWMREKGFDPAAGCKLILPAQMRREYGACAPFYVDFSPFARDAVLINPHWQPRPRLPMERPFGWFLKREWNGLIEPGSMS